MLTPNGRTHEGRVLVEAAVDTLEAALAALAAGADRLELCARLDLDGLTPDDALIRAVLRQVRVPVFVMVRPRPGDFTYDGPTRDRVARAARAALAAGAAGLVVGALSHAGEVDAVLAESVSTLAAGRPVTFHRAYDQLRDPPSWLARLHRLGVSRVLTSGGAATAWEGRAAIAASVRAAPPGLRVVAGGGVRADHVVRLVRETGAREVHLAASRWVTDPAGRRASVPDPERLRGVVAALTGPA